MFRSENLFNEAYWMNLFTGKRGGAGDSIDIINVEVKKKDVDVEVESRMDEISIGKKGISVVISEEDIDVVQSGGDVEIDT